MLYDWVRGGSERGDGGVTVYLDEVFLVNAAVNGLLLETSVRLTGGARSPGRLIGAAALGGVYAAAVWLPGLAGLASIPGQLAAWAGLCALCFGWRGAAWKSWLWFFGVSVLQSFRPSYSGRENSHPWMGSLARGHVCGAGGVYL